MNQLRQLMIEELRRRNFADTTIRTYLHSVAHFSRYFQHPAVPILACRTCPGTLADSCLVSTEIHPLLSGEPSNNAP